METISNEALAAARAKLDAAESRRENILLFHIANGVNIENRTVQIDEGVVIAPGATILAGTILHLFIYREILTNECGKEARINTKLRCNWTKWYGTVVTSGHGKR